MAWTAPMTFTAGSVLTAAQLNTYLRDNLLETAPAKASSEGQYFVATAANAITARTALTSSVVASQSHTGDTNWVDLGTVGPTVTVTTGSRALVIVGSEIEVSNGYQANMGYDISGATTLGAGELRSAGFRNTQTSSDKPHFSTTSLETGLTPGSNTFTAKYKVSNAAANGIWGQRNMVVIPF